MHRTDYQTLSNSYNFHAWNILSDTKQRMLISYLEQTIRHKTTHTSLMHRTDYQTLNNPY